MKGIQAAMMENRPVTQADLDAEKNAQNQQYLGLPEKCIEFAEAFQKASGLVYQKRYASDWIATVEEWIELGATPKDITIAVRNIRNARGGGIVISRPGSITFQLKGDLALRRSTNVEGDGIDHESINRTKRMLDQKYDGDFVPPPPEILENIKKLGEKLRSPEQKERK